VTGESPWLVRIVFRARDARLAMKPGSNCSPDSSKMPSSGSVQARRRRSARRRNSTAKLAETVRHHVKAMFRETGAHSQEDLVKLFDTGERS